jgi:hypothetical protein
MKLKRVKEMESISRIEGAYKFKMRDGMQCIGNAPSKHDHLIKPKKKGVKLNRKCEIFLMSLLNA